MEIIYKVLISLLCIMLIVSSGLALSLSSAMEIETNNYFENISQTVAESNYSQSVIDRLIAHASETGHTLSIVVHGENRAGLSRYAEITLRYTYKIPLFGISIDKVKQKVL